MVTEERWYRFSVNPEPWAVGPLSVGRKKQGGLYPYMGRNEQLFAFKEAVREEFGSPDIMEGKLDIHFWFWRQLQPYRTVKTQAARKHEADATNMQKALEDALQGYLFSNDRDNYEIGSTIVVQTQDNDPGIIVRARPYTFVPPPSGIQWRN